ncbi:MAG: multicopper oxidase domain-containing protein [Candidatus Thermoplasmatota archaeon]|nr:multicopper oxidase domain-containing protein [Candidatus Thermoplasmatota archaeon]
MTIEKPRTLILTLALVMVAAAGCLGVGEASKGEEIRAQNANVPASWTPASKAIAEAGFSDPYLDVEPTGVIHEYDFWVDEQFKINPWGDREFIGFAFTTNPDEPGTIPGPEIRVTQGDTVRVNLHIRESLFAGHTIHWHGVDVPWESDGVPFLTQDVATKDEDMVHTYEFVARQPGTYWYHCVIEFPAHIDHGMFGTLIVEPADPTADLPFDREQTLVFHEADSQYLQASSYALHRDPNPDRDDISKNPVDALDSAKQQARTGADVVGFAVGGATGEYLTSQGPRDYFPMYSAQYRPQYDVFMINGKSYPPQTITGGRKCQDLDPDLRVD